MAKSCHFKFFSVKKKTDVAFKPSGERSNPTKRFDTHLTSGEISDISSTKNSSSLLHDKLYEVRMYNISDFIWVIHIFLAKGIALLIDRIYSCVLAKLNIKKRN